MLDVMAAPLSAKRLGKRKMEQGGPDVQLVPKEKAQGTKRAVVSLQERGSSTAASSSSSSSSSSRRRRRDVALVPAGASEAYEIQDTRQYNRSGTPLPEGTIVLPNTLLLNSSHDDTNTTSGGSDDLHRHFHALGSTADTNGTDAVSSPPMVVHIAPGSSNVGVKNANQAYVGNQTSTLTTTSSFAAASTVTPTSDGSLAASSSSVPLPADNSTASTNDGRAGPGPGVNIKLPIILSVSVVLVVVICLTIVTTLYARARKSRKDRGLPRLISRWRQRRARRRNADGTKSENGLDTRGQDSDTDDDSSSEADLDEKLDGSYNHDLANSQSGETPLAWTSERQSQILSRRQTQPAQRLLPNGLDDAGLYRSASRIDNDSNLSRSISARNAAMPALPPAYRPSTVSLRSTIRGFENPHINDKGLYRSVRDGQIAHDGEASSSLSSDADDKETLARLQESATAPGLNGSSSEHIEASAPPLDPEDEDDQDDMYQLMISAGSRSSPRPSHRTDASSQTAAEKKELAAAEMTLLPSNPFEASTDGAELPRYLPREAAPSAPCLDDDEEDV